MLRRNPDGPMRLRLAGAALHLGRLRKDGYRCVLAARLDDWRAVLPKVRRSQMRSRRRGRFVRVRVEDDQLLLPLAG